MALYTTLIMANPRHCLRENACRTGRLNINTYTYKNKNLKNRNKNESENRNETGEDTYAGALRAPRAGSPAFVSVFVFVLIYV